MPLPDLQLTHICHAIYIFARAAAVSRYATSSPKSQNLLLLLLVLVVVMRLVAVIITAITPAILHNLFCNQLSIFR